MSQIIFKTVAPITSLTPVNGLLPVILSQVGVQ